MKNCILCVGVDKLDHSYYQSQVRELNCCNNDATDFYNYLTNRYHFYSQDLFTDCNSRVLLSQLEYLSEQLEQDDNLIIYYSGHGGQVDDLNGDEIDDYDQTWCLKDRQVIDDELYNVYAKFRKGVNIIVFSDSCHSGSVVRGIEDPKPESKKVEYQKSQSLFDLNRSKHENILNLKLTSEKDVGARIVLISGCQDDESSYAGVPNSQFTQALLEALETSKQKINLKELFKEIKILLSAFKYKQTPNFYIPGKINQELLSKPFNELLEEKAEKLAENVKESASVWSGELFIETSSHVFSQFDNVKFNKFVIDSIVDGIAEDVIITVQYTGDVKKNHWQAAHEIHQEIKEKLNIYLTIIPCLDYNHKEIEAEYSKSSQENLNSYLKSWPPQSDNISNPFDWYKKIEYSQLEEALNDLEHLSDSEKQIRIAHIDSGYYPDHPSTPKNLNTALSKSFILGEESNKGILRVSSKGQATHGMGTLGILAGNHVEPKEGIFKGYKGEMGAIPFAEVLCLRIAEKVHFSNGKVLNAFTKAVQYAIDNDCKVITMSMGGLSSKGMAKVVNMAYEKGIVFVSAAGNNFNTWWDLVVPEQLIYPARYHRVLAACGATYNQWPYDFKAQDELEKGGFSGERMQGNSGPKDVMSNAIAAYTPNIPWPTLVIEDEKLKSMIINPQGGGTSAATPQVAAAAALWLTKYKADLKRMGYWDNWKCVEALKYALRKSADRVTYPKSDKYYGMGILKAFKAMQIGVKTIADSEIQPKAQKKGIISLFKDTEVIALAPSQEMLDAEMEELLSLNNDIQELYQKGDMQEREFREYFISHPYASQALKNSLN